MVEDLVFMTVITGRKRKEKLVKLLSEAEAKMISVVFTRDYINAGLLRYAFGLIPDEDEVLVNGLLTASSADSVFEVLYDKFNFKNPKTGVAFTVKVDAVKV